MSGFTISNINFELGALLDIGEIIELKQNAERLKTFRAFGLSKFSLSEESEFSLALKSAKKTITESALDPSCIDCVIYSSSTLSNHDSKKQELSLMMKELLLSDVYP